VADLFGAGANGGVAAALIAGCNATPRYSFRVMIEHTDMLGRLSTAAAVVVGEGRLDKTTLTGKAPGAIALLASAYNLPVFAVAGSVDRQCFGRLLNFGILNVQTLTHPECRLEVLMDPQNARFLLREAGVRLAPVVQATCQRH
jgi:glycerate kinase